jgi:hypothetical protein
LQKRTITHGKPDSQPGTVAAPYPRKSLSTVGPKRGALRNRTGAAAQLVGATMADAWRSVLKESGRYRLLTPSDVVAGVDEGRFRGWRRWLRDRYLT